MTVNKVSMLEVCNDLRNINSSVAFGTTISKKTKASKTNTDKSNLAYFSQQTSATFIPNHFNHILNTFVLLDMVVNKLIKKRVPLYFDKISEVLKETTIKNFDLSILGQILRIFPESYYYEFDKPPLKITRHYKEKLKLIPNLDYGNNIGSSPKKPEKYFRLDQLMFRKASFQDRLLRIVRDKHIGFLMGNENMSRLDAENLSKDSKWHEEFNLEREVEHIDPIILERSTTDGKLCANERLSGKSAHVDRSPANKRSPLKDSNNINSVPFSRLSITKAAPNVFKENVRPLSNSPLALTGKSACKLEGNEKTATGTAGTIPEPPLPTESKKHVNKPAKQSPKLPSGAGKPLNLAGRESSKREGYQRNRVIVESPSSKSIISPAKVTPARPDRKSGQSANRGSLSSTPRPLNQSRLSFTPGSPRGTPRGNFIANLAVPGSPVPVLKDEFLLKQKLPAHLKILCEMFIALEKTIYDNRRQNKVVSVSAVCGRALSKYRLTELQLGRIVAIYPSAYSLRWEKISSKPANKLDITITPNLATSKHFLKFDFEILKERRKKFLENCFEIVVNSYREFLAKNGILLDDVEEHIKTEEWNRHFNIDLHVKQIEPSPMPLLPKTQERLSFSVIKNRLTDQIDTNQKLSLKDNDKLKSLPQSLKDRVLQNKAKSMIYQQKPGVKLSLLSELVEIIATEFERSKHAPISQSHVASIVCKSLFINQGSFNDYLNKIIELVPEWLEKLKWTNPTLSLSKPNMSLEDVQFRLKKIIAEQA